MKREDVLKILKAVAMVGVYGGLLIPPMFLPFVIFPFVFSKLVYFQVLIGLTFPFYLALAWADAEYRPKWTPLGIAVTAYLGAIGLSVLFAEDPLRAWWGNQERMNGLFTVLHFYLWFLMTSSLVKTWAQWRRLLIFEVGVSVFMAIVAILQKPFPRLLRFEAQGRVGGLLDNPIYMAGYQIFNFFFIGLLWMKNSSKTLKIWLLVALGFDLVAFVLAQSRGALLGLAVGVMVFGFLYAILGKNKKLRMGAIAAVLSFFGLYAMLFVGVKYSPWLAASPLARFTDLHGTTETRFIAWQIAWKGFLERPVTGWGFDNFHIVFNKYYNPNSLRYGYYETWFDRAHNTVMDVLAMTGLVGIVTFIGIWVALFYSVIRAYRKQWIDLPFAVTLMALPCAYFVQNLFVFDQPAGFTMSFFLYALISRATRGEFVGLKEEEAPKETATNKTMPWPVLAIGGVFGLFVVYRFSVLPFRASALTIDANNYFSAGLLPQAFDFAKRAAEIPTPYLDEQTFLQSRNLMNIFPRADVREKFPQWKEWHELNKKLSFAQLEDHYASTHPNFIFARYLQDSSRIIPEDAVLADKYFKQALETSPARQQLLFSYGRFKIEKGETKQGYELFRKAADFDPEIGEAWWYAGISRIYDLKEPKEGAEEVIRSQTARYPYQPATVKELGAIAIAHQTLNDREGLKNLIHKGFDRYSDADAMFFLDFARLAEQMTLIEERDLLLDLMVKKDPTGVARLVPLKTGKVKTIMESFAMTEPPKTILQPPTPTPIPVSTTPKAPVKAGSGTGPRR